MNKNLPLAIFLFTQVVVLIFILATASSLPATVASHFNAAGVSDGYMPRDFYTVFILIFTLGIPSIIVGSMTLIDRFPESSINLPNKRVWLSERYRESTFAYLRAHTLGMGALIVIFMGYVHWLVIQANRQAPAHLSTEAILGGLVIFMIVLVGWGIALPLKFMQLPKERR